MFRRKDRVLSCAVMVCLLMLMLAGCFGRTQADPSGQTDQADSGEMGQAAAGLVDPLGGTEEEGDAIGVIVDEETGITIRTGHATQLAMRRFFRVARRAMGLRRLMSRLLWVQRRRRGGWNIMSR